MYEKTEIEIMNENNDKIIKALIEDEIDLGEKTELSFPTDVSSKAIVTASTSIVPMNLNEQKFLQETIESYDKCKITAFELCLLGLFKIRIERTPQEKKIVTIQRYRER